MNKRTFVGSPPSSSGGGVVHHCTCPSADVSDDCAAARRTRTRCVVEEENVCRAVVRAAGTFPKIAEVDERDLHPALQPVPNRRDDHARPAAKAAAG